MTTFISLLTAYYLCDTIGQDRVLPADMARACAATYEAVKAQFPVPPGVSAAEANATRYRAFKAWEADNALLVGDLRSEAAARVAGVSVGM